MAINKLNIIIIAAFVLTVVSQELPSALSPQVSSVISVLEADPVMASLINIYNTATGEEATSIYNQVLSQANNIVIGAASMIAEAPVYTPSTEMPTESLSGTPDERSRKTKEIDQILTSSGDESPPVLQTFNVQPSRLSDSPIQSEHLNQVQTGQSRYTMQVYQTQQVQESSEIQKTQVLQTQQLQQSDSQPRGQTLTLSRSEVSHVTQLPQSNLPSQLRQGPHSDQTQVASIINILEQDSQIIALINQYNSATGDAAKSIYTEVLFRADNVVSGAASLVQQATLYTDDGTSPYTTVTAADSKEVPPSSPTDYTASIDILANSSLFFSSDSGSDSQTTDITVTAATITRNSSSTTVLNNVNTNSTSAGGGSSLGVSAFPEGEKSNSETTSNRAGCNTPFKMLTVSAVIIGISCASLI